MRAVIIVRGITIVIEEVVKMKNISMSMIKTIKGYLPYLFAMEEYFCYSYT